MAEIILDINILKKRIFECRLNGKKIVFTNGCFDILHAGHIHYLKEAKKLGDFLLVALNSDESVKKIKGDKRPLVSEKNRMIVMEALYFVDFVTLFNEETPYDLIKMILPDVLVKGGDWDIEKIVGKDIVERNGGTVVNIPFKDGFSTTSIIEKIREIYC